MFMSSAANDMMVSVETTRYPIAPLREIVVTCKHAPTDEVVRGDLVFVPQFEVHNICLHRLRSCGGVLGLTTTQLLKWMSSYAVYIWVFWVHEIAFDLAITT